VRAPFQGAGVVRIHRYVAEPSNLSLYTDKKENEIFLKYEESQSGAVANIYEEGLPNI
jgi:hypothetical protein